MRTLLLASAVTLVIGCGHKTPPPGCADASDCAANQTCEQGKCVDVASPECKQDSDCVDPPGGQTATGATCADGVCHYPLADADSFSLIEQARDQGQLSDATAMQYQVYAVFGDDRLPEAYRSTHPLPGDAMVLGAVRNQWSTFDQATRDALAPFLLPPTAPGSWLELREEGVTHAPRTVEWRSVDSGVGARVWYQPRYDGDDAKAAGIAAALVTPIVGKIDEVMGGRWLPDDGLPNNGGDGRLDIYLVRGIKAYGLTTPYGDCQKSAAWIIVDSAEPIGDEQTPGLVQTVAHETLHAVQMALPYQANCRAYFWLFEMTAVWFEDVTYPEANSEQMFAKSYLTTAYWSLDGSTSARWYGEYLWPFFLTRVHTFPLVVIGNVFRNAASQEPLDALDNDGRFGLYWSEFVADNWNREPVDFYQTKDKLTFGITPYGASTAISPNLRLKLPSQLTHLSAMYYDLRFDDDAARAVHFYNGLGYDLSEQTGGLMGDDVRIDGDPVPYEDLHGMSLQALIKVQDQPWTIEDWSYASGHSFCRDLKAQRLERLVLVVGNGEHKKDARNWVLKEAGLPAQVISSDIACWRWSGKLSRTVQLDHGTDELTATVVWQLDDPSNFSAYQGFKLASGTVTYHHQSSDPTTGCEASADATFDLGRGEDDSYLGTQSGTVGGGRERSYWGYASSSHLVEWHGRCPDPDAEGGWVYSTDHVTLGRWWMTRPWLPHQSDAKGPLPAFSSGNQMVGDYTEARSTWRWNLSAAPE